MESTVTAAKKSEEIAGPDESDIDISSYLQSQDAAHKTDSLSSASSDHFFNEDLVWPDPENVFPRVSGIKPSVLCAELRHMSRGSLGMAAKTRCQTALMVRKTPRPKHLPWNVVIIDSDPPRIEADDVEEYLVHDPLFVEFFNAFLALPSFAEAVLFNIDTGGFEVMTDGKRQLAQQIKEAVRSLKSNEDIYEHVHQHAFIDIPVVPIEDSKGTAQEQIERTFDVTTLNKERGIVWVKAHRLPSFLESDFYFQYRLAKVISQATIFNEKKEFVVMKIDYTTKPKAKKNLVEVQPPTQEELIMKDMYVSFGDLKGAAKEAWFTQAKRMLQTDSSYTTLMPRSSQLGGGDTTFLKQKKKSSVFNSYYFGSYTPGLIGPGETEPPIRDSNNLKHHTSSKERPFTPRPADRIHAATTMLRAKLSKEADAEEEMTPAGHVVFIWPKQDMQKESVDSYLEDKGDREAKFLKRIKEQQIIDQIYSDGSWEEGGTGNIVLKSVDELGAVIVGAVMKKTIREMLSVDEETVLADPAVSGIYPSKDLTCVSVDKLNLCVVLEPTQEEANDMSATPSMLVEEEANVDESYPDKQPVHVTWNKTLVPPAEDDPDKDSLLDSDEDFEERDEYFRRSKDKWHSLTSMKGIFAFKKFLAGTQGEKYWELWLDIDKGHLIKNEEEKQRYILHMRDKFYKKGSPFELSAENKKKLQLDNICQWVPEHLFQVQAKVLEPLVLYWAPRYLLRHLMPTQPQKYYLYNEMVRSVLMPPSDPHPHTQELLPLGPKSCCLTTRTGPGLGMEKNEINDLKTMPVVGNRRVYGKDTLARLLETRNARFLNKRRPSAGPQQIQQPQRENLPAELATGSSHLSLSSSRRNSRGVDTKQRLSPSENTDVNETFSKESVFREYGDELQKPDEKIEANIPCPYNRAVDVVLSVKRESGHGSKSSILPKGTASAPYYKSPSAQTSKHPKSSSFAKERQRKSLVSSQRLKDVSYADKTSDATTDKCPEVKSKLTRKHDAKATSPYTFYRQDSKDSEKSCPKRHHLSKEVELAEQQECEFLNSERLEFLLQALHHERNSGRAFRKFIEKSEREDWLNSLDFWEQVQDYRKLFYKDKLDLHLITRHARSILAHCIVEGAPQAIRISEGQTSFILDHLIPPYEDLFDRAEENVLKILFRAFQLYLTQDVDNYCEVERAVIQRRLETRNPHILDLQKQGIIKEGPLTPDDPMEGYVDPVCDDSVLKRVPEHFQNWNMEKLSLNKLELEYFKQFLIPRFAEIDLKCWMDMEAWRRTPPGNRDLRDQRAIEIKKNYLNKKYFFGPNSPATKDGQNAVMEAGGGWGKFLEDKPHHNTILKAQKYVRARLENKHLPFFLASRDFQERHLIDSSNIEEDEDPFINQRRRTLALMRVLSDGENAFENLIDKKDKLFEDLTYWTAKAHSVVDSMEDQLAGARELQTTWSGKSLASMKHIVLPQIGKEATPEAGTAPLSEHKFERRKSIKSGGSSKTEHRKTRQGSKMIARTHFDKSWHEDIEASARRVTDQKPVTYSRWDVMMMRHGTQITPTGLIDNVCHRSSIDSDEERPESRWVTVAREVFLLQRALKNPQACSQFSKFVSLSEGFLENDILFWLEADRYKKMIQSGKFEHVTLKRKMNAIINCFINSYLPPALQIDIPEEMANEILMRRPNYPPDLLRFAQPEVFRMLLPQWMSFREYHKKLLKEDRVMATLERHRAVAMGKELKYREKLAQERELESMYRQQLAELEAERLRRLAEGITLEGDEAAAVPMTYSQFVLNQQGLRSRRLSYTQAPKGTQTIRGIPQYDYQPIEERPGYEDDPDVDENAKHYSLVDYIIYREYLKENPDLTTLGVHPSSTRQEKPSDIKVTD